MTYPLTQVDGSSSCIALGARSWRLELGSVVEADWHAAASHPVLASAAIVIARRATVVNVMYICGSVV
jgi:hypothetical protein